MAVQREIKFIPNPTQKLFIEHQGISLFASRMGEGKSAGLCWKSFYHTRHNPTAKHAVIRDTWENNRDTTQKEFFEWFQPGILGEYVATTKTFTWRAEQIGLIGSVQFMGLDDPDDASKLQSRDYGAFFMDEPAPAAETGGISEMIFDVAISRLRQRGMNWYCGGLAENNPDETHWTYRRFVEEGFTGTEHQPWTFFQTEEPENIHNLPPGYYENIAAAWAHRPDLQRRFIQGQFGFQQIGKAVTPEFNEKIHLAVGLKPLKGRPVFCFWDFGHNPTCIIAQVSPMGHLLVLYSFVGEDAGTYELIDDEVKPCLAENFGHFGKFLTLKNIGDPAGLTGEQARKYVGGEKNTAVRYIRRKLGGSWKSGPVSISARIDPLRERLRKLGDGVGMIIVDKKNAKHVWHALRGGWARQVSSSGVVHGDPMKNIHSHPGDALGYGVSVLFPLGAFRKPRSGEKREPKTARFAFQKGSTIQGRPGLQIPKHGDRLKVSKSISRGRKNAHDR